jgi:hypothetical protein
LGSARNELMSGSAVLGSARNELMSGSAVWGSTRTGRIPGNDVLNICPYSPDYANLPPLQHSDSTPFLFLFFKTHHISICCHPAPRPQMQ